MAQEITKRHPIRGFIWGIFFGLGLALIAIGQGYAALGTWPPLILLIVGIVVGTLWGLFAPAKKPKGEPPREQVPVEALGSQRSERSAEVTAADPEPETAGGSGDEAEASDDEARFGAPVDRTADSANPNEREMSLGELASSLDDEQDPDHDPD